MIWLLLGLLLFIGVHSIRMVLPGLRAVFLQSWGDNIWKGLYSATSIMGIVLIVIGYGAVKADGGLVYIPPSTGEMTTFLMLPTLILMMAGNLPTGRIKAIVQHPMTLAVVFWSFSHLLANGDLASVIMFGSFFIWSVALYFQFLSRGRPDFAAVERKYDVMAIAIGFGIYVLFVLWAHKWLFGVAPISAA